MTFKGTLRPYQFEPVRLMKERGNMLLAAEQGTGKTTMTINVIEDLFDDNSIREPGLVIALSTLKEQWAEKIEEFTEGTSKSLIIPGGEAAKGKRAEAYESARNWDGDYILMHYEQVVNDWDEVVRLPAGFMVVDEASFIRGANSNRAQAVKALATERKVKYRYALTGTPIENGRPEEMYSIMEFVDPDLFGRWDIFDRTFIARNNFGQVSRYRNLPTFHKTLAPAMIRLRAIDPGVREYMPETDDKRPMRVGLDKAGRDLYQHIATGLLADLEQAAKWGVQVNVAAGYGQSSGSSRSSAITGQVGSKMLALQMLCDHPDLLRDSARRYRESNGVEGSAYIDGLEQAGLLTDLNKAPKYDATLRWIKQMLELDRRNKIVLFTRYVKMAEILNAGITGSVLYTGANVKQRGANLKWFQNEPSCRVLVATDAGGFGLDIPQANLLLNYDLPDGAGLADQRDTRIVRTSSEFTTVSRNWIVIADSIEEYKQERLDQKRKIRDAFVDATGLTDRGALVLTARSLTEFLRTHTV